MSADQVAEIVPGIRESIAGGDRMCASFVLAGDDGRWVQFMGGTINAAYPHSVDPARMLAKLGGVVIESYEPGTYLTVRTTETDARTIARWIDGYFEHVLGAKSDYAVDLSLERL